MSAAEHYLKAIGLDIGAIHAKPEPKFSRQQVQDMLVDRSIVCELQGDYKSSALCMELWHALNERFLQP
jgi:hypothetical protein